MYAFDDNQVFSCVNFSLFFIFGLSVGYSNPRLDWRWLVCQSWPSLYGVMSVIEQDPPFGKPALSSPIMALGDLNSWTFRRDLVSFVGMLGQKVMYIHIYYRK